MNKYNIITDEAKLDDFIKFLPDITETEVFYLSMFGRHKYCTDFPNMRDDGQLSRFVARKNEIKEKLLRLEAPIGSFIRNDAPVPQEAIAIYISLNPRSLPKANKELAKELINRIVDGDVNFNPVSLATTAIHRATGRKIFMDFDYDEANVEDYLPRIQEIFPDKECYRILKTRGGFHLLVVLEKIKELKNKWHQALSALPNCDVRGTGNLTPVPGCTQGGFTPYFIESLI